jgi:hypothetical protein
MSSSTSLVPEIEMDKMIEHSVPGCEKRGSQESVAEPKKAERIKFICIKDRAMGITSVPAMKIGQEKFLEHSGGTNAKLVDESETLRTEENGSCRSWVVDIEKMVEQANPSVEMARWKQRSIYRVPEFMKKITNRDAYEPQFVSLGPYHHGVPHLLPMEEHKRRALVHLVKRAGKPPAAFVEAIEDVVDELQAAYDDLDDKWRGEKRGNFVEMMVTDGCFLLELASLVRILVMKNSDKYAADDSILSDYAADDPIFSECSISNLWSIMRKDMISKENQLPLVVLQRLLAVQLGTSPVRTLYYLSTRHEFMCVASLTDRYRSRRYTIILIVLPLFQIVHRFSFLIYLYIYIYICKITSNLEKSERLVNSTKHKSK